MAESILTKRAIADSLIELTKTKPFDKISVKDITERCGLNRQTFYYHFEDKYILLEWIYENDLIRPSMDGLTLENWPDKLEILLTAMREDKRFYINTITHTENYIQQYMNNLAQMIFQQAIDAIVETDNIDKMHRDFLSKFFAYGTCGMIIEWVEKGMVEEPHFLARSVSNIKDRFEIETYEYILKKMQSEDK